MDEQNIQNSNSVNTAEHTHKRIVVMSALFVVAIIIVTTIWGIMGGFSGDRINEEEQAAQKAALEQKAREDAKIAAQNALLEQQALESQRIIQERNIKPPTEKELKQQALESQRIIQERNIKPPTQAELDQQAAESAALLRAMQ